MVRGLTPLYFPCNGNTEKGAFPTFYDEITLPNVVKYTCYQADDFKRSDRATFPMIDQPKREVTLHGNAVKLSHREFEILGLFASHPNQALSASFLHNAVWLHPDSEHGEEEAAAYVRSLQEKLGLNKSNPTCRIVEGTCAEKKGCCFTFLVD